MGKDRFSNQKPWNYSKEFKFHQTDWNDTKLVKPKLDEDRKSYLKLLKTNKLTDWENSFINSILDNNVELSDKQKEVVLKISRKFYKKK
jgi:sulfur relay (sulfurtransferase) DsrC/TusE family protein